MGITIEMRMIIGNVNMGEIVDVDGNGNVDVDENESAWELSRAGASKCKRHWFAFLPKATSIFSMRMMMRRRILLNKMKMMRKIMALIPDKDHSRINP